MELLKEAGVPDGVVNLVNGTVDGKMMLNFSGIGKIRIVPFFKFFLKRNGFRLC